MIIIEASGGLGNQMFQYALYKKLEFLNKDVVFDTSFFRSKQGLRELEIGVFGVQYRSVSDKEVAYIRGYGYQDNIVDKIKYKLRPSKYLIYRDSIESFQPEVLEMEDVYLCGYWQSDKYFKDIRELILKEFTFPIQAVKSNLKLTDQMKSENSVSIHVRRSDYLTEQNLKVYGNICTEKYYNNAINYIEGIIDNPHYYVFADDLQWAKEYFKGDNYTIVGENRGKDSYIDMYLMSQCKHNIIANSSFSWWGAWLNQNFDKKVLAPKKWFHNHEKDEIVCEDWIRIENR